MRREGSIPGVAICLARDLRTVDLRALLSVLRRSMLVSTMPLNGEGIPYSPNAWPKASKEPVEVQLVFPAIDVDIP